MASKVTFDMADPATKKMIDGWADNTEYQVMMTVRTGSGPQRNVAEVVEVEEENPEETQAPEEESDAPESESSESAGPAAVKSAMAASMPGMKS